MFFGELLREKRDPIKSDIKDVLAQVRSLQHELITGNKEQYFKFQKTTRLLIDDSYKVLFQLITKIFKDNFDEGISKIISASSLEVLFESDGWKKITNAVTDLMRIKAIPNGYASIPDSVPLEIRSQYPNQIISFGVDSAYRIIEMNELTAAYLHYLFQRMKEETNK